VRVLVADDDSVIRAFLRTTLERAGHEVLEAGDGKSAWELFQQHPVEVVIADWEMPELDGLEVCRRVRALPRAKYTYLVLLTSRTGKKNYLEGMDAGADDFVSKPASPQEVLARMRVAQRILGLQAEIKQLEGLLPICAYCKRIHRDDDTWQQLEVYIEQRSDAEFSHGVCPECYATRLAPQIEG
jgi:sigma-B regulation protein RsbU (phosphoserine phosphatase)